ncbi:hypothetical protein Fmac_010626 [Flemingia macrophylla]|uniref:Uncharacterized protein n=1 Tax=Flemingia macrophylla TaxID=520843 RepID=A0ABD1MK45_9FABA
MAEENNNAARKILLDLNNPVSHNRAISAESVNNYITIPASVSVHAADLEMVEAEETNNALQKILLDLNKPPSEVVVISDEGGFAAPVIRESEKPKGEVGECSSPLWANKRKKIYKWLSATTKIFKKKKKNELAK